MVQFFIGTCMHKMIGLETVQVLQFAFFVRMVIRQKSNLFMNSLNPLKYSAYGGYTNSELIYGSQVSDVETLTEHTVEK